MKRLPLWLTLAIALFAAAACAKKEITPLQRKQAANLVSEAEFAANMKDFARAETLLAQATSTCPDTPGYWLSLGSVRIRQANRSGAKAAYQQALGALQELAKKNDKDADSALQQVYVLVLLGRVDDARGLQAKLQQRFPNEPAVRAFVEQKRIDQMLADPQFKQYQL